MKIGDLVKPKDFVSENKEAPAGIVVEIKHSGDNPPDYRKPTAIKCSFPGGGRVQQWYYKHELEVLLENR